MKDLSDRRKLFEEELPHWENIIASLAFNLLQTRAIDRGLLGMEDIQNSLRAAMWDAIEKYDIERGTKLNTWITKLLKQKCALITQAHYNKQPRDSEGHVLVLLPLTGSYGNDEEEQFIDVEDPEAQAAFDMVVERQWFSRHTELVRKVLKVGDSLDEQEAFTMILSGEYQSDREIADILKVNFAKVGDVRLKARIVFAILEHIPLRTFTQAHDIEKRAKRIRNILRSHVEGLPDTVM